MRKTMTATALASLLVLATGAMAQDDAAPLSAIDELAAATAAPDVQPGQIYLAENYGDWEKRCIRAPEGEEDRCNLYQLLSNAEGQPVAEFNLFKLPEGGQAIAGANVVVPLETLLTQQLTITVDQGELQRYPFAFCNAAGCVARVGMTQEDIDELKRGNQAVLRLVPVATPDEEFLLNMSLAGFTAGFDSLTAVD
jgi:invasion protein IalB